MFSATYLQNLTSTTEALAEEAKATNQGTGVNMNAIMPVKGKGDGSNNKEGNGESAQPSFFKPNPKNYAFEGRMVGASLGILGAVGYAFKTKSGFLKGLGYWVLGGLVLGGVGYGVGLVIKKKKKNGEG